jgi:hypothetical protein
MIRKPQNQKLVRKKIISKSDNFSSFFFWKNHNRKGKLLEIQFIIKSRFVHKIVIKLPSQHKKCVWKVIRKTGKTKHFSSQNSRTWKEWHINICLGPLFVLKINFFSLWQRFFALKWFTNEVFFRLKFGAFIWDFLQTGIHRENCLR